MKTAAKTAILMVLALSAGFSNAEAQTNPETARLAELASLKKAVANMDTRVRVPAMHRAWIIGRDSIRPDVKIAALQLMLEPAKSSSDHIRVPAIYAISDIAIGTTDTSVKVAALQALREPANSGQVPARDIAIDALNTIVRSGTAGELAAPALAILALPVRSGNNAVRMPAIHAILRLVEGAHHDGAYNTALDLMRAPLGSDSVVGGMEARLFALTAVRRIGVEASVAATKAKAYGMAREYADGDDWEPEARALAREAAEAIKKTM